MEVKIKHAFMEDKFEIYVYDKRGDRLYMAKPVEMELTEVKEYKPCMKIDNIKPFLEIDGSYASEFFAKLARELAKLGFRETKDEEQLKDVLKAKEFHLEDMRKLVFKEKK